VVKKEELSKRGANKEEDQTRRRSNQGRGPIKGDERTQRRKVARNCSEGNTNPHPLPETYSASKNKEKEDQQASKRREDARSKVGDTTGTQCWTHVAQRCVGRQSAL
jgi:hypothetical protein